MIIVEHGQARPLQLIANRSVRTRPLFDQLLGVGLELLRQRSNKILVVLKLRTSVSSFPVDGESAGFLICLFIHNGKVVRSISCRCAFIYANHYGKHLANRTNH